MQTGGNAADAAVAMAAALNLLEPCSTGIGGDAFALFYNAQTKQVHCLQGNGAAAGQISLEVLLYYTILPKDINSSFMSDNEPPICSI